MSQLPSILKEIKSMILRARNLILRGPRKPPARLSQRARRARLLPALALLLGVLSLFAAAPAQAQTVTFSNSRYSVLEGKSVIVTVFLSELPLDPNVLDENDNPTPVPANQLPPIPVVLSHGTSEDGDWGNSQAGAIRTTESISISNIRQGYHGSVHIPTHRDSDTEDETFTVALDTGNLPTGVTAGATTSVEVTIIDSDIKGTVKLVVSRNPVPEGSWVRVDACLSEVSPRRVSIPVVLSHGTSENGDWGNSLSGHTDGSLPIRTTEFINISGDFLGRCGGVNIPTHRDSDEDDETFTVSLGALPPALTAGTPSSVEVTITDSGVAVETQESGNSEQGQPEGDVAVAIGAGDTQPVSSDLPPGQDSPPPVVSGGDPPVGEEESPPGQQAEGGGSDSGDDESSTADSGGVPGAPVNLMATPGDGKLVVRWQEPAQNGGFDLAHYQLQYQQTTHTTWHTVPLRIPASHSIKTYTLSSLPNGVAHNVRVRVYNRNPDSALAHSAWATTTATPIAAASKQVAGSPASFELAAAYPNPFNPTTTIRYALPQATEVELTVYNVLGQPVRTLVAEHQRTGWYAVEWDASGLAAGLYFYRLQAGEFRQVKKMLLLK